MQGITQRLLVRGGIRPTPATQIGRACRVALQKYIPCAEWNKSDGILSGICFATFKRNAFRRLVDPEIVHFSSSFPEQFAPLGDKEIIVILTL